MGIIDFPRMVRNAFLLLKLSGNLTRRLVLALHRVADKATVYYSRNGISMVALHPKEMVTVVLRINPTGFEAFSCKERGVGHIDLHQLFSKLKLSYAQDSIIIHAGEDNNRIINILFADENTCMETCMRLIEAKEEHVAMGRNLRYEYRVVLGILSTEFRRVFGGLRNSGKLGLVFITVTNWEAEFASIDAKFVLAREHGEYICLGVGERDQVFFVIDLSCYWIFMILSYSSDRVYIFHSNDAPPMLNFPMANAVDGNIMFYFNEIK